MVLGLFDVVPNSIFGVRIVGNFTVEGTVMSISEKHWQQIEKSLKNIFMGDLVFTYQNHEIIVSKMPYNDLNMRLEVFIDGCIKGEWMLQNTPMKPILDKVWNKKTFRKYKQEVVFPYPYFNSTRTFLRQYKKIKGLNLSEKTIQRFENQCDGSAQASRTNK